MHPTVYATKTANDNRTLNFIEKKFDKMFTGLPPGILDKNGVKTQIIYSDTVFHQNQLNKIGKIK